MLQRWIALVALGWMAGSAAGAELEDAYRHWLHGNVGEAKEIYTRLQEKEPTEAALGIARCLRAEGAYEPTITHLEQSIVQFPDNPDLLAELADMQHFLGRDAAALERAEQAIKVRGEHLQARWVRARVLSALGRQEDSNRELEWFIQYYNDRQPTAAEDLLFVALASSEFARWNQLPDEFDFILNTLLVDAASANPDYWQIPWFAGSLLVEKYNRAEGVPELKKALAINPRATEALIALGVSAFQDYDFTDGHSFADQALATNPNHPDALCLKADLLLADSRTDQAIEQLKKALAVNPVREETLGRLAACHLLKREADAVAKIEEEIVKRNPKPGVYYSDLADQLERRRQFDLAEKYYQKAIAAAPHLSSPLNGLGMLEMRIGKEDEARQTFERARKLDPFHVRVLNFDKVLNHLEGYRVIESPHYAIYVRPDSDDLLGRYVSEFMEEVHPRLCQQLGYEPKGRTKIEIMVDHKWFSARVVGLPSIGTVGACTGRVVALASPRSLRTPFNWARVLTHEVTHVITLEQTNFNIPHWFTEALAVHSEGYPRPQVWNELLVERVPANRLFNLDNINHAFVRPPTPLDWQMAYCQSLLYARYMMEKFGDDTIAKLLNQYRDGVETDAAIPAVFKMPKAQFEEGYREYLKNLVAGLNAGSTSKPRSFAEAERAYREKPDDPDLAAELAEHYLRRKTPLRARELADKAISLRQGHPHALYVLARMELSIGKVDEAESLLAPAVKAENPNTRVLELMAAIHIQRKEYDKAAQMYEAARREEPLNSQWTEGLARVYLMGGQEDKLKGALEQLAGIDSDNLNARKKLAQIAAKHGRWEDAQRWALESMYVKVDDVESHRIRADSAMALKNYPLAVKEYQVLLELSPTDPQAPVDLAKAHAASGETDAARKVLQGLLERDPNNADAKRLLGELDNNKAP